MTQASEEVTTRRDPAIAAKRRAVLKDRALRFPGSAFSEREVWSHCRAATIRTVWDASEAERDALGSEVAERVLRRYGVALADGWRVARSALSPQLLDWETRVTVRRSAIWRDVEDAEAERMDRDGWGRERAGWIAPTHGADAAALAERVAGRFPAKQRTTVARFLLAASEAKQGKAGPVYGPELAAKCGCSLATLRQSVKRGREYVARIDADELADWLEDDAAALAREDGPAAERDPLVPALAAAARAIGSVMADAERSANRASRGSHLPGADDSAGAAPWDGAPLMNERVHWTAAERRPAIRPLCDTYPAGMHPSGGAGGCNCHG